MLDRIGVGNDFADVTDGIPVGWLECKSNPRDVLDRMPRATDRGNQAKEFICQADK